MADGRDDSFARLSIAFRIRSVLDRAVERGQHPLHFPQLLLKLPTLTRVENAKSSSALELSVHFMSGREGNHQIPGELTLAPLPGAFGDVVAYGVDSTEELRSQPWRRTPDRSPEVRLVALDRQLMCLCQTLMRRNGYTPPVWANTSNTRHQNIASRYISARCALPSAICYLLSAICYLLSAICYLPSALLIHSRLQPAYAGGRDGIRTKSKSC
jgi:hypothetical protein